MSSEPTVVAFDLDGARYCWDCAFALGIPVHDENWQPDYGGVVFRHDLDGFYNCDGCREGIDE